jgi:superfamily II DNA or RNA helicase
VVSLYENATHLVVTGTRHEIDDLVDRFKYRPKGYFYSPAFERFHASHGAEGWDGWNRPFQRLSATAGRILRGRKAEVVHLCEDFGYKINAEKVLLSPFAHLTLDDVPADIIKADFQLDDNQRMCIREWLAHSIGICHVTVAGGKTAMYAGAVAVIRRRYATARFLYITPSERLVRQVVREMRKFLPDLEIGQFGGGVRDWKAKDMVVCTVAMVHRHFNVLHGKKWFESFSGLLYDEVHHAGSDTSKKIVLAVPAFFRLGASDSLKEDNPDRHFSIIGLFGPVLNEVKAAPLIVTGRLAKPHIYVVDERSWHNKLDTVSYTATPQSRAHVLIDGEWQKATYLGPVYEKDEAGEVVTRRVKTSQPDGQGGWVYAEEPVIVQGLHRIDLDGEELEMESRWCLLERMYDRCVITFKERNDLILKWAKTYSEHGLPTVVVCTRTIHVYILEALLASTLPPEKVGILIGDDSPSTRDERFQWLRDTPGAVLITPLVKEGVSINELQAGIVADYVSDWEVANQIIGRFLRKKSGAPNRAHITWFRDRQHTIMRRGSNSVFKRLEQEYGGGYTFYDPAPDPETVFEQPS